MVSKGMLWLIAVAALSLAAFGQNPPRIAPVPSDPLELVTGQIQVVDTPASREAILQLLARARNSYALRSAGHGYDLKVTFTVNSGGQTEYDGAWEMEDMFDPQQGLRWTAKAAAGYTTTQISSNQTFYGEGTASTIPLRLHEARAALFDPIPSSGNADRALIRTSTASFQRRTSYLRFALRFRKRGDMRRRGDGGRKPRSVSIHNPGCSRCIRKYLGATTLTTTRTHHSLAVTCCLER